MRTIIITGVSRGLGQALSKELLDEDTRLVGFGRAEGDFRGVFHSCDLCKPQLAASIFENCLASEPLEDSSEIIFIANAGRLGLLNKAQDLDVFDIEETISANLIGSAIAVSAFLKRVETIDAKKLFAQITSGAALPDRAKASWSLYCASKAGQEQLIRSVAKEQDYASYPTKLININPGIMETRMQEQIRGASPESFPEVERFIKMKEEGRIPSPVSIAKKISELFSDLEKVENGKTYSFAEY